MPTAGKAEQPTDSKTNLNTCGLFAGFKQGYCNTILNFVRHKELKSSFFFCTHVWVIFIKVLEQKKIVQL